VDETRNGLVALRHALETLVAPAVSGSDPIASEQLVSAVRYLDFVLDRVDLIHQRERYELRHACDLAETIADGASSAPELSEELARGRSVLADPEAATASVRAHTAAVRAAVREVVLGGSDARRASALVLAAAGDYAAFERSWYAPLGFDTEPGDPLPLSAFLDAPRAPGQ
jgi:hypothetical protein